MRSFAIAMAATVLLLAGCGEKDEPEPSAPTSAGADASTTTTKTTDGQGGGASDQATPAEEVESAVQAVLGGGDPAAECSELSTARYVKAAYGDEQGCRAAANSRGTVSVKVSAIQINGQIASAKAVPESGPNKDETIKVELVEEDNVWKVDSAVSNAPAGP